MNDSVLSLRDFRVSFPTVNGPVQAVRGVDLDVGQGEMVGVVGESGSGKSVTFLGLMGLLPRTTIIEGSATVHGDELVGRSSKQMRSVRGKKIAMIFQDPLSALNPVHKIGRQIVEMIQAHENISNKAAHARAVELLDIVGIPQPDQRAQHYPHEFSGGMRQRVMIAMAIANEPEVLIADEPTTALDVTVQAQIMALLRDLRTEYRMAVVLITHDLALVAEEADRVAVMYAGNIVETGTVAEVFGNPKHPYTKGLLNSVPVNARRGDGLRSIGGSPPDLHSIPEGCVYQARCPIAQAICAAQRPVLDELEAGAGPSSTSHLSRKAACHFPEEVCNV